MDSQKAINKIVDEQMGYFGLEERAREPLTEWAKMIYGIGFQHGNEHPSTKHKMKPVLQKDLEGNPINCFLSISIASRVTGVDKSHISKVCLERVKTAGGFTWEFVNYDDYFKYRKL